jgi:AraC-like DNA-binding protein
MKAIYLHARTIPGGFVGNMALGLMQSEVLEQALRQKVESLSAQEKVSLADYIELVDTLKQRANDEMLGLLPNKVPEGCYDSLCNLLQYCPTLNEALNCFIRFYNAFNANTPLFHIERNSLGVEVSILNSRSDTELDIHFARAILLLLCLYKTLCWLSSSKLPLTKVLFGRQSAIYSKEIAYLFGCHCETKDCDPSLFFPASSLHSAIKPSINASEHARLYLPFILSWLVQDSISNTVYACIAQYEDFQSVNQSSIASALKINVHTLGRRLRQENSTFQQEFDRARYDRARQLLRHSELTIQEIAFETGYADGSTFSRAFKQWAGCAPAVFRELGHSK